MGDGLGMLDFYSSAQSVWESGKLLTELQSVPRRTRRPFVAPLLRRDYLREANEEVEAILSGAA